ncbi:MAG: hypothetical protein IT175_07300 [Acidobacteria bacterium]|nr:hypothetical protein [Acidobacteriota bacterium]
MLKVVRTVLGTVLATVVAITGASAAGKKAVTGSVPGEEDFRSATGYTVVLMEHCKAVNRLARGKGAFNVELAREHAAEITRSAASASRHVKDYLASLGQDQKVLVTAQSGAQQAGETAVVQLAGKLDSVLQQASPDRAAVSNTVTELYLAAKDLLVSHKAAGKTLGIAAATPPRKAAPRKPRAPKAPKAANAPETTAAVSK